LLLVRQSTAIKNAPWKSHGGASKFRPQDKVRKNNRDKLMARFGQTKRAVMIVLTLALVLILATVIVYSRTPLYVPAATQSPVQPLVATPVAVPVPSRTISAAPGAKSAQAKAKIPPRIEKSTLADKPVPVPIVAATIQAVAEVATAPAPMPVPAQKEALIQVSEPAAAIVDKQITVAVPEAVPATVPVIKEASVTVPEPTLVTVPKVVPIPGLSPAKALPLPAPSTPTSNAVLAGTAAAIVLAPIAAPVSIIVGIAVGLFAQIQKGR
jgi:hypothetical protein